MKPIFSFFTAFIRKYFGLMLIFILMITGCSNCPSKSTSSTTKANDSPTNVSTLSGDISDINTAILNSCSSDEELDWDYVINEKAGVSGKSPDSVIGYTSLTKFLFLDNWAPYIGSKTCLCGDFNRYEGYVTWFGNERDWNFILNPTDPYFKGMLDFTKTIRPVKYDGDGNIKHWYKNNTTYFIEGELTPTLQNGFGWFKLPFDENNEGQPQMVGKKICFYGPWVSEGLHNYRPEIHPAELVWFEDPSDANSHYLIVAQDASSRFSNPNRYVGDVSPPWKPWSKSPINGVFKIPFKVNKSLAEVLTFTLETNSITNITNAPPSYAIGDNSPSHTLKLDNVEKIKVIEPPTEHSSIGIQFVEMCKSTSDANIIQGYVQIAMSVGVNSNEGLFVLKVKKSLSGGITALVADKQLRQESKPQLQKKAQSFQSVPLETSRFTLTLFPEKTVKNQTDISPDLSSVFHKINDLSMNSQLPISAFKSIDFKVKSYYCPNKEGECEPEEGDVYQKELDMWLIENKIDTNKSKITWTFTGINLVTKEKATVKLADLQAFEADILVSLKKVSILNDALSIVFPKVNNAIFRLFATATVIDSRGNKAQETFTFDSQSIEISPNKRIADTRLLEETVRSMGLNYDSIFAQRWKEHSQTQTPSKSIYKAGSKERPDLNEIRYQMLFNYYQQMPLDGNISDKEIQVLKNAIKQTQTPIRTTNDPTKLKRN